MPVYMGEDEVIKKNMGLAREHFYTVQDMECMPEDEMAELIDGRIYYMAAPAARHQEIVTFLCWKIQSYLKANNKSCRVYTSPYAVFLDDDGFNYIMPDISVICDRNKIKQDGCHGAPDFVAEIVSKSSQSLDYLTKLLKYKTAGVREYWIVDPLRQRITVYDLVEEGVEQYTLNDSIKIHIFEECWIDFKELD